jgi:hypothetical protein
MKDGLRRIYPRKEGKENSEEIEVFCAAVFGELICTDDKRGSWRWNDWTATLLK